MLYTCTIDSQPVGIYGLYQSPFVQNFNIYQMLVPWRKVIVDSFIGSPTLLKTFLIKSVPMPT